jgi:uncharacterized coiled-coil protein SlyX
MSEVLEQRIGLLEQKLQELDKRLAETASQTSQNNQQLAVLNSKLDEIRATLNELKALPQSFVPRHEIQARLDATQQQMALLGTAVNAAQEAIAETNHNHLELLKSMHSNTTATYVTLITVGLSALGLTLTLIMNWSPQKAAPPADPPAVSRTK